MGIEIANMGAYGNPAKSPLPEWYVRDADGRTRVTIPERFGDGGLLTKNFVGRPRLNEPVVGMVQGQQLTQYDFTPEQYAALVRLTDGSYGYSIESGKPIPRERLEAIPWATVLVEEKVGGIGRR